MRGNVLPTAVRSSRARTGVSIVCAASQWPGSLGHILQVCLRTHNSRVSRHDKIVSLLQSAVGKAGWSCIREAAIPTAEGLRRPDLISITNRGPLSFWMWRLLLTARSFTRCMRVKSSIMMSRIARNISDKPVQFSSVLLSWRGLMARASAETLC